MNTHDTNSEAPDQQLRQPGLQQPPRGWWSRNWRWFVPTLLLAGAVVCCGGFTGILALLAGTLRSEPYPTALKLVQQDTRVIQRLGQPIRDVSWLPSGEHRIEGNHGEARLDFDVAGPKGRAHVHFQARRVAGTWGFSRLEVSFGPRERISIQTETDNEAPPFQAPKPEDRKPAPPTRSPDITVPVPPADVPGGA